MHVRPDFPVIPVLQRFSLLYITVLLLYFTVLLLYFTFDTSIQPFARDACSSSSRFNSTALLGLPAAG